MPPAAPAGPALPALTTPQFGAPAPPIPIALTTAFDGNSLQDRISVGEPSVPVLGISIEVLASQWVRARLSRAPAPQQELDRLNFHTYAPTGEEGDYSAAERTSSAIVKSLRKKAERLAPTLSGGSPSKPGEKVRLQPRRARLDGDESSSVGEPIEIDVPSPPKVKAWSAQQSQWRTRYRGLPQATAHAAAAAAATTRARTRSEAIVADVHPVAAASVTPCLPAPPPTSTPFAPVLLNLPKVDLEALRLEWQIKIMVAVKDDDAGERSGLPKLLAPHTAPGTGSVQSETSYSKTVQPVAAASPPVGAIGAPASSAARFPLLEPHPPGQAVVREPVRLPVLDHRHVSASAPTKWFVSVYGLKGLIRNDDRKALAKALKLGNDQPYLFTSLQPVLGRWRCLLMYCNRDSAEIAINERVGSHDLARVDEEPLLTYELSYPYALVDARSPASEQVAFRVNCSIREPGLSDTKLQLGDIDALTRNVHAATGIVPIAAIANGFEAVMRFASLEDARVVVAHCHYKVEYIDARCILDVGTTFAATFDSRPWNWHETMW